MIFEENCECGMSIPKGYGYYNYGMPLTCFGCGRVNQKAVEELYDLSNEGLGKTKQ